MPNVRLIQLTALNGAKLQLLKARGRFDEACDRANVLTPHGTGLERNITKIVRLLEDAARIARDVGCSAEEFEDMAMDVFMTVQP